MRSVPLDQFRGYTVLGMIVANALAALDQPFLRHAEVGCAYADTLLPQFFFAAGMAYRWTYLRHGSPARVARRCLGLLAIALVLYGTLRDPLAVLLKRHLFQALTHIAVTSLWVLPVIGAGARVRILFALGSAAAHVALGFAFNHEWVRSSPRGIEGGPLGFLAWTVPLVAGSLVADLGSGRPGRLVAAGAILALAGWALSRSGSDVLAMAQRTASVPYVLFTSGAAMLLFALFEASGVELPIFRTLGRNALTAYVLHLLLLPMLRLASPAAGLLLLPAIVGVVGLALAFLERRRLVLKFSNLHGIPCLW
jgi:predicted acyltransferase